MDEETTNHIIENFLSSDPGRRELAEILCGDEMEGGLEGSVSAGTVVPEYKCEFDPTNLDFIQDRVLEAQDGFGRWCRSVRVGATALHSLGTGSLPARQRR